MAVKRMLKNTPVKAAILILTIVMLLFSGVQTTRAALTYQSNYYVAETEMKSIGISLVENGSVVSGELLKGPLKVRDAKGKDVTKAEQEFQYGVTYTEELAVQNSGSIDQYARVIVTRYWLQDGETDQAKSNTDPSLDPRLIKLHPTGNWIDGGTSASGERLVFYYPGILGAGQTSSPFIDAFQVDGSLAVKARTVDTDESGRIRIIYEYDGRSFVIAAEAQCVQTHNADLAVTSAWGADAASRLGLAGGGESHTVVVTEETEG